MRCSKTNATRIQKQSDSIVHTCDWLKQVCAFHQNPPHILFQLPAVILRRLVEYDTDLASTLLHIRITLVAERSWRMQKQLRRIQWIENNCQTQLQNMCQHTVTIAERDTSDYNHLHIYKRCTMCNIHLSRHFDNARAEI
jgi:hypothetical protein